MGVRAGVVYYSNEHKGDRSEVATSSVTLPQCRASNGAARYQPHIRFDDSLIHSTQATASTSYNRPHRVVDNDAEITLRWRAARRPPRLRRSARMYGGGWSPHAWRTTRVVAATHRAAQRCACPRPASCSGASRPTTSARGNNYTQNFDLQQRSTHSHVPTVLAQSSTVQLTAPT